LNRVLTSGMALFQPRAPKGAAPAQESVDPGWIGKTIQDRYRIEEQLGAGGVGAVYRARHLALDRSVALKVLRKQHNERWVSRQRFEREARELAKLSHSNIVAISDCGIDGDTPFLVMELLEGKSLEARLREGPLPVGVALGFALELLEGLSFMHGRGLVHRDIKPGNVFLEQREQGAARLKILDFGLAKLVVQGADHSVTRSGEVLGTPAYMAPEQATGEPTDARTDVYAVGLLLFEMLVGRRPFRGVDSEVLRQQLIEAMPLLSDTLPKERLSRELDVVLQKATAKEKSKRFPDAKAMASALEEVLGGPRRSARPPARLASRPPPAHSRGARRLPPKRRGVLGRVLSAGAVLVCGLALAAIVVAASVIYLLDSPEGSSQRVLLERALSSPPDPAPPARPKPQRR
jgi:eukaryotic-like serine/threonine-protein kinase